MIYVMALRREPTPEDDRTWQMVTLAEKPEGRIGGTWVDDEEPDIVWSIADIFKDSSR